MCFDCGFCDCSCAGNLFYVVEKIVSCCAITAATCCIAIMLAISIGIGVGVGYNYCFVEIKGNPSTTPEPHTPELTPELTSESTSEDSGKWGIDTMEGPTIGQEFDENLLRSENSSTKPKEEDKAETESFHVEDTPIMPRPDRKAHFTEVLPLRLHDKDVDYRFLINMLRARNKNVTLELYT